MNDTPTPETFGPPWIPPSTGYPTDEADNKSRQFPLDSIPQYPLLKKLIPQWMGARNSLTGRGPSQGYVWGSPTESYGNTVDYSSARGDSNYFGMSNDMAARAAQNDPDAMGGLGYGLARHYQDMYGRASSAPSTWDNPSVGFFMQDIDARRNTSRNFAPLYEQEQAAGRAPQSFFAPAYVEEAAIMRRLARMYASVQNAEAQQQKYAPELRPH